MMETQNPDYVRIACPMLAELHGFTVGEHVPVINRTIWHPDPNDCDIYVHSPRFNRSIWLSTSEYSLIKEKEVV